MKTQTLAKSSEAKTLGSYPAQYEAWLAKARDSEIPIHLRPIITENGNHYQLFSATRARFGPLLTSFEEAANQADAKNLALFQDSQTRQSEQEAIEAEYLQFSESTDSPFLLVILSSQRTINEIVNTCPKVGEFDRPHGRKLSVYYQAAEKRLVALLPVEPRGGQIHLVHVAKDYLKSDQWHWLDGETQALMGQRELAPDPTEIQIDEKTTVHVAQLRHNAEKLQKLIDKYYDRARNFTDWKLTHRRAEDLRAAFQQFITYYRFQACLNNLANAIEADQIDPLLRNLGRSHVDFLLSSKSFSTPNGSKRFVDEMLADLSSSNLSTEAQKLWSRVYDATQKDGVAYPKNGESAYCLYGDLAKDVLSLNKIWKSSGQKTSSGWIKDALQPYLDIEAIGLTTQESLDAARSALSKYTPTEEWVRSESEYKLLAFELEICTKGSGKGFHPTPEGLAVEQIQLSRLEPSLKVFEPGAGRGTLIRAMLEMEPSLDIEVAEINYDLSKYLELSGYNVVARNFHDFADDRQNWERYDRIIANPDFTKSEDAKQIRKYYDLLAPGGRIVTQMCGAAFRHSDKFSVSFREWVKTVRSFKKELGSELYSKSERKANVDVLFLVIDKPALDGSYALDAPEGFEPIIKSAVLKNSEAASAQTIPSNYHARFMSKVEIDRVGKVMFQVNFLQPDGKKDSIGAFFSTDETEGFWERLSADYQDLFVRHYPDAADSVRYIHEPISRYQQFWNVLEVNRTEHGAMTIKLVLPEEESQWIAFYPKTAEVEGFWYELYLKHQALFDRHYPEQEFIDQLEELAPVDFTRFEAFRTHVKIRDKGDGTSEFSLNDATLDICRNWFIGSPDAIEATQDFWQSFYREHYESIVHHLTAIEAAEQKLTEREDPEVAEFESLRSLFDHLAPHDLAIMWRDHATARYTPEQLEEARLKYVGLVSRKDQEQFAEFGLVAVPLELESQELAVDLRQSAQFAAVRATHAKTVRDLTGYALEPAWVDAPSSFSIPEREKGKRDAIGAIGFDTYNKLQEVGLIVVPVTPADTSELEEPEAIAESIIESLQASIETFKSIEAELPHSSPEEVATEPDFEVEPFPPNSVPPIDVAERAKLIRKLLKETYPGQKFSVTSHRYAGGSHITLHWVDGPTEKILSAILPDAAIQYARRYSFERLQAIAQQICAQLEVDVPQIQQGLNFAYIDTSLQDQDIYPLDDGGIQSVKASIMKELENGSFQPLKASKRSLSLDERPAPVPVEIEDEVAPFKRSSAKVEDVAITVQLPEEEVRKSGLPPDFENLNDPVRFCNLTTVEAGLALSSLSR